MLRVLEYRHDLSFIGMTNCFLHHDIIVSPGLLTGRAGEAAVPVTHPVSPSGIGARIYTTFAVVDLGANSLDLIHSNAMQLTLGGDR